LYRHFYLRWQFEFAGYPNAKHPFLGIGHGHINFPRCQGDDPVNNPDGIFCYKMISGLFMEEFLSGTIYPIRGGGQVPCSVVLMICRNEFDRSTIWIYRPQTPGSISPKVTSIYIAGGQPVSDLVGVISPSTGRGFYGISTGDGSALRCPDRKQHRFGHSIPPKERGKRLSIDHHIDRIHFFIVLKGHPVCGNIVLLITRGGCTGVSEYEGHPYRGQID